MTKFLLISGDSEKEKIVMEVFPADEVIVSADETMIFDVLKVEEPDIVIVDGDIETLDLKPLCRKIKQYPVVIILLLGEKTTVKMLCTMQIYSLKRRLIKNFCLLLLIQA